MISLVHYFNGPLFVYFRLFHMTQFKYKLIKAEIVCFGLKPRAAGWKSQTNPLSYGGTPIFVLSSNNVVSLLLEAMCTKCLGSGNINKVSSRVTKLIKNVSICFQVSCTV